MIIFSEKLYATSFGDENPIADAVIKQCPHLSEEISKTEGVEKRLSGNEILNILCEGQCEEQKNYGKGNYIVLKISKCVGFYLAFIVIISFLIFYLLDTYFLLDLDSLCSDFERRIVNDVESCRSSVSQLKSFDPRSNFKNVESTSDWPSGCYSTNSGIYFNTNSTGNRNPEAHPICKSGMQYSSFHLVLKNIRKFNNM